MRSQLTRRNPQSVWDFMNEMNSIFDSSFPSQAPLQNFRVSTDIEELEDGYLFSFDLPGIKKEDIQLDFTDGILKVTGERKRESKTKKQNGFERIEKNYGKFERSFQLPNKVDSEKIQAHFENGLLEVIVPKSEVAKAKTISIDSGKGGLLSRLLGSDSDDKH